MGQGRVTVPTHASTDPAGNPQIQSFCTLRVTEGRDRWSNLQRIHAARLLQAVTGSAHIESPMTVSVTPTAS
jgi:hypothetical protein